MTLPSLSVMVRSSGTSTCTGAQTSPLKLCARTVTVAAHAGAATSSTRAVASTVTMVRSVLFLIVDLPFSVSRRERYRAKCPDKQKTPLQLSGVHFT